MSAAVQKGESLRTWAFRNAFNAWPCYWGSGGKVMYMSSDYHEARVRLKLTTRTRNYVGTVFGGSLYASIDPIYMLMLMNILGKEYIVWDKAANIRFKKPGKGKLEAKFLLTAEEVAEIKRLAGEQKSVDRVYLVEYRDEVGDVVAAIEKTLYIRRKGEKL